MRTVPTLDDIRAWPATVDVPTAGRAFGIGRDESYRLVHQGAFPVPVLKLGRYLRVTRSSVLAALGIDNGLHSGRKRSRIDETVTPAKE
jgi:predicted DNA-binding transcriptional regulator AlpA